MEHDKRPLTAMAMIACVFHGAAVVWRGIRNAPQPPGLELWVTALWLLVAVVLLARRRNARVLAGALVALAFFATNLRFLFAPWLPRGMRANTTASMVHGEHQLYAWHAYSPGDHFLDAAIPDDTLCVLFGLTAGALVVAAGQRAGLRVRRTHANADEVAADHFARPLLLGLTGWVALIGLPGRVEDVVRRLATPSGHEVAAVANCAGAFANLVPFCALLALTLVVLARSKALLVLAATSGAVAVVSAAVAAWLDGGLLWSLATTLPTPADPGVVVIPAVVEGRPAWAVAIVFVAAVVVGVGVYVRRQRQHG